MVGPEMANERTPTTMSTQVTNNPKLSATTTSKLVALASQSSHDATAAPTRPITPSGAIGIRSPRARNASAVIAAIPAAVTHAMGVMALRDVSTSSYLHRRGLAHAVDDLLHRGLGRLQKQVRHDAHQDRERHDRHDERPLSRL